MQRQEQEARERHGAHEYTVYQLDQPRIRVQRLRKEYLQKRRERQVRKADFVPISARFPQAQNLGILYLDSIFSVSTYLHPIQWIGVFVHRSHASK
jgi:hypothetical protein